jgi:glycosyltransferase involved in cell wall biosynthesis
MRVCHVSLGRPRLDSANGVDKTIFLMTKYSAQVGHQTVCLCYTEKAAIPIPGVEVFCVSKNRNRFYLSKEVRNFLKSHNPDLICLHSVNTPENWAIAKWAINQRIPYTVRPAGGLANEALRKRFAVKWIYRQMFEQFILENALFVHSVGDSDSIKKAGVKNTIKEIPRGVEVPPMGSVHKRPRQSHLAPEKKRIFLFVGRVDIEQKGLDLLLKACNRLPKSCFRLIIAGPDVRGQKRTLESMARSLGLTDSVEFHPPVFRESKQELMVSADVFVHASRWEGGIPHAVLEAAALGLPVLVTTESDPMNHLGEGGGGIRVSPTADGMADGLLRFAMMTDAQCEEMGGRARQVVSLGFSWENCVKEFFREVDMENNRVSRLA